MFPDILCRTFERRQLNQIEFKFRRIESLFPTFKESFLFEKVNLLSIIPDIGTALIPDHAAKGDMPQRMNGAIVNQMRLILCTVLQTRLFSGYFPVNFFNLFFNGRIRVPGSGRSPGFNHGSASGDTDKTDGNIQFPVKFAGKIKTDTRNFSGIGGSY